MSKADQLRKDRSNLLKNLKDAVHGTNKTPSNRSYFFTTATLLCLLGTTLPFNSTNILFGILSLVFTISLAITLWIERKCLPSKHIKLIAAGVIWAFFATGCSGLSLLWVDDPPTPIVVIQNPDKEYKKGFVEGYSIFGFGLEDTTEETAMRNGNIDKAYAIIKYRSNGWISMAKVWVYGE